jgi:hypothetical protein
MVIIKNRFWIGLQLHLRLESSTARSTFLQLKKDNCLRKEAARNRIEGIEKHLSPVLQKQASFNTIPHSCGATCFFLSRTYLQDKSWLGLLEQQGKEKNQS